jgi:hypothetical protein
MILSKYVTWGRVTANKTSKQPFKVVIYTATTKINFELGIGKIQMELFK